MSNAKILTVQDISCVGQCSLTVALPIISACGIETCVLPSAVLSTHTGGFSGFTFRDLTEDMPKINAHWQKEGIRFDTVYTGYLGSARQIGLVKDIISTSKKPEGLTVVDPAMADNGKLYFGFDDAFVTEMKTLCSVADYLLPNITEACFLTDTPYRTDYDEEYVDMLFCRLQKLGCKSIVLTGVSYEKDFTGVAVRQNGTTSYYRHEKIANGCHGTGDIYASAFVGALSRGKDAVRSAQIAADFTVQCIKETQKYKDHWYGARFEPAIPYLIELLK